MLRFVHGGRDSECSGVKGGRETRDEDGADAPWEAYLTKHKHRTITSLTGSRKWKGKATHR